jgi:hypothetical protein
MFAMIIKHARNILRGNGKGQGTYIGHYLSFVIGRRENGLLDLGDLALPLLLEAGDELLELSCFLGLPTFLGSLAVHLERLALLLRDLIQSQHDVVLWINLRRHVQRRQIQLIDQNNLPQRSRQKVC